jgi:gliding motility-associated-like protein
LPTIASINRQNNAEGANLTIEVEGGGDYEFALDDSDGAYQDSPVFEGVAMGSHTIFVRDRNGCGVTEKKISLGLPGELFPRFFTPNGDGINDYWQYKPIPEFPDIRLKSINIFDRYGSLLAQIDPASAGWDGNMNGHPMPASNYWFRASDDFDNEITGYFALKR